MTEEACSWTLQGVPIPTGVSVKIQVYRDNVVADVTLISRALNSL